MKIHSYERIEPCELDILVWPSYDRLHADARYCGAGKKAIQSGFHCAVSLFLLNLHL